MDVAGWVSMGIAVMTAFALILTVREYQQQVTLQVFTEYEKRFSAFASSLPEGLLSETRHLDEFGKEKEEVIKLLTAYFDLTDEEFRIMIIGGGIFAPRARRLLMMTWLLGFRDQVKLPVFRDVLEIIKEQEMFNETFRDFITELSDPNNLPDGKQSLKIFKKAKRRIMKHNKGL